MCYNQNVMKKMDKALRSHKAILFLDFEGTMRTQEMIAIGAVLCFLNSDGTIKRMKDPFKIYVRATTKVGSYVEQLTGITDAILKKEGHSFYDAMVALKKYCGLYWKKCLFCTFGNNDIRILNQTIAHNLGSPIEICHQIHVNYFDFGAFISEYIRDENGNTLSLVHLCELFKVELAGQAHDPSVDAVNLANLYNAFLINKEIVVEEYQKVLLKNKKFPEPIQSILERIVKGDSINQEELKKEIRRALK